MAVGRSLVINPGWVELAQTGQEERIDTVLDLSRLPSDLTVPDKLWGVIEATPGWFPVLRHEEIRDEAAV